MSSHQEHKRTLTRLSDLQDRNKNIPAGNKLFKAKVVCCFMMFNSVSTVQRRRKKPYPASNSNQLFEGYFPCLFYQTQRCCLSWNLVASLLRPAGSCWLNFWLKQMFWFDFVSWLRLLDIFSFSLKKQMDLNLSAYYHPLAICSTSLDQQFSNYGLKPLHILKKKPKELLWMSCCVEFLWLEYMTKCGLTKISNWNKGRIF